jgi:transcriptional regulator GlxA family with amidase domain
MSRERTIGILIFDDAEGLDFVGPYEVFTMSNEMFARSENRRPDKVLLISETGGTVTCAKGMRVEAHCGIADAPKLDVLLVPGGMGTRREVGNKSLLDWLARAAEHAEIVASVCTGSALLAKAGLLDGKRATTNKRAFDWVRSQGPKVAWQPQARWVEDGKFWTSSGVSAGTDMALALIARLCGIERAHEAADWAEYIWNEDSTDDPFAIGA